MGNSEENTISVENPQETPVINSESTTENASVDTPSEGEDKKEEPIVSENPENSISDSVSGEGTEPANTTEGATEGGLEPPKEPAGELQGQDAIEDLLRVVDILSTDDPNALVALEGFEELDKDVNEVNEILDIFGAAEVTSNDPINVEEVTLQFLG